MSSLLTVLPWKDGGKVMAITVLPPKTNNAAMIGQLLGMILGRNLYNKQMEKSVTELSDLFGKEAEKATAEVQARRNKIIGENTGGYMPDEQGRIAINTSGSDASSTAAPPAATAEQLPILPSQSMGAQSLVAAPGIGRETGANASLQPMPTADTRLGGTPSLSEALGAALGGDEEQQKQVIADYKGARKGFNDSMLQENLRPAPTMNQSTLLKLAAKATGLGLSPEAAMGLVKNFAQDYNTRSGAERDTAIKSQMMQELSDAGNDPAARNAVLMKYISATGRPADVVNAVNALSPHYAHYTLNRGGQVTSGLYDVKTGKQLESDKPVTMRPGEAKSLELEEKKIKQNEKKDPVAEAVRKKQATDYNDLTNRYHDLIAALRVGIEKENAAIAQAKADGVEPPSPDPEVTKLLDRLSTEFADNGRLTDEDRKIAREAHLKFNSRRQDIHGYTNPYK
jgi:hypothetical protein